MTVTKIDSHLLYAYVIVSANWGIIKIPPLPFRWLYYLLLNNFKCEIVPLFFTLNYKTLNIRLFIFNLNGLPYGRGNPFVYFIFVQSSKIWSAHCLPVLCFADAMCFLHLWLKFNLLCPPVDIAVGAFWRSKWSSKISII